MDERAVPQWEQIIWRFVRREMDVEAFEPWAYTESQLEALMSPQLYLQLLDTDYRDREAVFQIRRSLCAWLDREYAHGCHCLRFKDNQALAMSHEDVLGVEIDTLPDRFMARFDELKLRTPWLSLVRCKTCGQAWYLACDTDGGDFYLQRLSEDVVREIEQGRWPDTFDRLKAVWP